METDFIKAEIYRTGESMGRMEHYHRPPTESIRREVVGLRQGMLKIASLEQWLEYMDSAINSVMLLMEESMRNLEGSVQVGTINQMGGNK